MWKKVLFIIILFYFFALLQNSFFTHFSFFGAIPNLVFIFFFLLVFFSKNNSLQVCFFAAVAGFFLDIFSYTYIAPSIILLLLIGFLLKKIQLSLKNRQDSHPFIYFLPLFIIFLSIYDLLMGLYLYFLDSNKIIMNFGIENIFNVIYSTLIASLAFYLYKIAILKRR